MEASTGLLQRCSPRVSFHVLNGPQWKKSHNERPKWKNGDSVLSSAWLSIKISETLARAPPIFIYEMKVMLHHSNECKFQFLRGDSVIFVFSYFRILKSVWFGWQYNLRFPHILCCVPSDISASFQRFTIWLQSFAVWPFSLWSHAFSLTQIFEICFSCYCSCSNSLKSIIIFCNKQVLFPASLGRFRIQNLMWTMRCRICKIDEEKHIDLMRFINTNGRYSLQTENWIK